MMLAQPCNFCLTFSERLWLAVQEYHTVCIRKALDECSDYLDTDCVMDKLDISYEGAEKRTSGAMEMHDALVILANRLRNGEAAADGSKMSLECVNGINFQE